MSAIKTLKSLEPSTREKDIIRIRKGLNGFPYSCCDMDGCFMRNAESIEEIRVMYKRYIRDKSMIIKKELDLFPKGKEPNYVVYGYARVSSRGQERDGNSLEAQEAMLKAVGAQVIYKEVITGTVSKRPVFDKLLNQLNGGDTLIVTKLDRIARSITQGEEIIKALLERRVTVNVLNMGVLDNSPAAKVMRQMLFAFSEFERDMIITRTQEGKAVAKTKAGYKEGRPRIDQARLDHAMDLLQSHSYKQVAEMTGISTATIARERRRIKNENNECCITEKDQAFKETGK